MPALWGSITEHTREPLVAYLFFVFNPSDVSSFLNQFRRAWSILRTARKLTNNTAVVSKKDTPSNTNRGAKIFHTMRWRRCIAAEQHVARSCKRKVQISNKNLTIVTVAITYMCADTGLYVKTTLPIRIQESRCRLDKDFPAVKRFPVERNEKQLLSCLIAGIQTLTPWSAWYMSTRRNIRVLNSSGLSIQSNSPLLDWRPLLFSVPSTLFGIWGQNRTRGRQRANRTGPAKVLSRMRRPGAKTRRG